MTGRKKERGLCELYEQDPLAADYALFGRRTGPARRGFLKGAGLAAISAVVGGTIPFNRFMPAGLIPAALAEGLEDFVIEGKDGLVVLSDRPINAETPAHLLNDDITPISRHFVRNNGHLPPITSSMDASDWTLTIDGEVDNPMTLSLDELKSRFSPVTLQLQIECGAAMGVRLLTRRQVVTSGQWVRSAMPNGPAYVTVIFSRQRVLRTRPSIRHTMAWIFTCPVIRPGLRSPGVCRSPRQWKHNSIVAWAMNGEPIPAIHGFPVRTICPGWPGSTSHKWLSRIQLRDVVHDGAKMTGTFVPRSCL